jgi:hypothetical protein
MLRFAPTSLLLLASVAAAQAPPIPPSVLRPDVDVGRMIRPPPEPLAVMRQPPGPSAVAEELARLGLTPSPEALAGRDAAEVAAALRQPSPPAAPLAMPPTVDLRGRPATARAIVEALRGP